VAKTHTHFRYAPRDGQPGFNSLVGDVVPDGVYEVRPELADRFVDHPDWKPASEAEFDAYKNQETS
jgi:hypothetical protein